jgi:hypothetical protein
VIVYGLYCEHSLPFYVGMGENGRINAHARDARTLRGPDYAHHDWIRATWKRHAPYRPRVLFDGLTRRRARDLEAALSIQLGYYPLGSLLNERRYRNAPPEARTYIRRANRRWRLPALIRVPVSNAAFSAFYLLSYEDFVTVPSRGVNLWLDAKTVARLDAAKAPAESYSDVILRLATDQHG